MELNGRARARNLTGACGCVVGVAILLAVAFLGNVAISCVRYGRQPLECSLATRVCVYDVGAQFCPSEKGWFGHETEWH